MGTHANAPGNAAPSLPGMAGAFATSSPATPVRSHGRAKWWAIIILLVALMIAGLGAVWQLGAGRFSPQNVLERYTQSLAKGDVEEALKQYRSNLRGNIIHTDVDTPMDSLRIDNLAVKGDTAHATIHYLIKTQPYSASVTLAKNSTWLGIFPRWTITDGLETPVGELFSSFGTREHGTSAYKFGTMEVTLDPTLSVDGKEVRETTAIFPGLYSLQPKPTKYFVARARQVIVDPEGKFSDPNAPGGHLAFEFEASEQLGKEASDAVVKRLEACANRSTQDCPYPVGGNYITSIEVNANGLTAECELDGTTFECRTSPFVFKVTSDISNEMFTFDPITSGGEYEAIIRGAINNDTLIFDKYIDFPMNH